MRRVLISLVSLWAVLWHAQVGCCAHHEHALAGLASPSVCAASHSHAGGASHQHDSHQHDAPPAEQGAPPAHDDCHESHCHVVIDGHVSAPQADGLAGWVAPLAAGDEKSQGSAHAVGAFRIADAVWPLALRAHLRLGVLLI